MQLICKDLAYNAYTIPYTKNTGINEHNDEAKRRRRCPASPNPDTCLFQCWFGAKRRVTRFNTNTARFVTFGMLVLRGRDKGFIKDKDAIDRFSSSISILSYKRLQIISGKKLLLLQATLTLTPLATQRHLSRAALS